VGAESKEAARSNVPGSQSYTADGGGEVLDVKIFCGREMDGAEEEE
jgi:hypothetical protein